jgi:hypothetical protein
MQVILNYVKEFYLLFTQNIIFFHFFHILHISILIYVRLVETAFNLSIPFQQYSDTKVIKDNGTLEPSILGGWSKADNEVLEKVPGVLIISFSFPFIFISLFVFFLVVVI